jgi:Domain of unknown function (DUF4276)
MARLLIHVEGWTEVGFVNELLRNHLGPHSVGARIIGNARQREQRGGIRSWPQVRKGIVNHLLEDRACFATTMIDYYGLPGAWPGRAESTNRGSAEEKARCVEDAMRDDLAVQMGDDSSRRFLPFIVMHEFEGLLFSDCTAFSRGISRPELEGDFRYIREQFATPEEIDNSPNTAPSKRVSALVPGYEKPLLGVLAVLEIGLTRILEECPHFRAWLNQLETLLE